MKKFLMSLMILLMFVLVSCTETTNDVNKPEITGVSHLSFDVNSVEPDWKTYVFATDIEDGEITIAESMIDDTDVDMNTIGSFSVIYTITDKDNNSVQHIITVTIEAAVVVNNLPIISGPEVVSYYIDAMEPDWTTIITATDPEDGTIIILESMIDDANVDMTTLGTFTVIYTITDSNDESVTHTITVTITIDPTLVEPTLGLNGEAVVELEQGDFYTELGATATDDHGSAVAVTITGNVDVNTVGTYVLTYTSSFDSTAVTRTVTIVEPPEPVNNFPLTNADMLDMKSYIYVLVEDYYNLLITDEDFCLGHYYVDQVFNDSHIVTGYDYCTTYRSSTLSIGGAYSLINTEYETFGYTLDGSVKYTFVVTMFYNGGPAFNQQGYRMFPISIIADENATYGYKEIGFDSEDDMLYVTESDLTDYVEEWATYATSGITPVAYCTELSYITPFLGCIDTMEAIGNGTLLGQTYYLTFEDGYYFVAYIELHLENPESNELYEIELPVVISQTVNGSYTKYDLNDALYYSKHVTNEKIEQDKQLIMDYLEDYWDDTMTTETFVTTHSQDGFDTDTYRDLDFTNNVDALLIDIVYGKYTAGFGTSFLVYYANDGVTNEVALGVRLNGTISQPSYFLKVYPE